jgi:pilus assembly protein CpaC
MRTGFVEGTTFAEGIEIMALNSSSRLGGHYRAGAAKWVLVLLFCLPLFNAADARAQNDSALAPKPPQDSLPVLPTKPQRTIEETKAFIDDLSTNDAYFDVYLGQSRVLTLKDQMKAPALIGVGDPSVVDFTVINPRQIRIVGVRMGVSDVSVITTDDKVYNYEVRVVADLEILRGRLKALYPDAHLKLSTLRDHLVVEGQARDTTQVARIIETIDAYQASIFAAELKKVKQQSRGGRAGETPIRPGKEGAPTVSPEQGAPSDIEATVTKPRLINLIRVPGPQQVLLKVRVAELNRTALRQLGTDIIGIDRKNGTIVGSLIGGASTTVAADAGKTSSNNTNTTIFGIFSHGDFDIFFNALRKNTLLKILAEPNLVAMNGHKASFLAGGKFPVPVAQSSSGGAAPTVTVEFQPFGVSLEFVPQVLDNDRIRLAVHPSVSSIDFTLGTVLVPGGTPVPGLNSREAQTTLELKVGQTLAMAGLLQLTLDGTTNRIPGLGDLPILGPFFSNTSSERMEKELLVLVTPYLVDGMDPNQVPPTPGDEVNGPTDLEVYLLGRIEGRTGRDFRATVNYECIPSFVKQSMQLEKGHVCGPHGFSN